MQEAEIYSRLAKIFRDIFDRDVAMTPETGPPEVEGWDSFAQVHLTLAIESEFGVKFKTSDLEQMRSVGDLAGFVERNQPQ